MIETDSLIIFLYYGTTNFTEVILNSKMLPFGYSTENRTLP